LLQRSKQTTIVLPAFVTAKETTAVACHRKTLTIPEKSLDIAKKRKKIQVFMLLHGQVFHVEACGDVFKISALWMCKDKGSTHPFVKNCDNYLKQRKGAAEESVAVLVPSEEMWHNTKCSVPW
jgi:hypothetical protein